MRIFVVSFLLLTGAVLLGPAGLCAQSQRDSSVTAETVYRFKPQQLIAPVALVSAGAIGTQIDDFKEFCFGLSDRENAHLNVKNFYPEDIIQYVPAASYYIIKLSGGKSVHNYVEGSVILALSYGITAVATLSVKKIAQVDRPNGMDNRSFPSGHSAVAFMGAEFLRMQYKDSQPWIGYAGYAVAAGTAMARVAHNEHWITDVLAGAGIGILGTKAAYWVYPYLKELVCGKIFKCTNNVAFIGVPYYSGNGAGVSLAFNF